jgi:glycosyltransferase involved in cell wall biosynthesis
VSDRSISVTLSLGNGPYQRKLPETLAQHGMLRRLFSFGESLEIFDVSGHGELKRVKRFASHRAATRVLWAAWRRLPGTRLSRLPVMGTTWLADQLVSKWISGGTIFHGWTATCLVSLRRAKEQGLRTLVENASFHPREWQREVLAECRQFGVDPRDCGSVLPEKLVNRREREFELCDRIVVPSEVAKRSFQGFAYSDKVEVVLPGVDHAFFSPGERTKRPETFRVCYMGRVELAKGVGYLLQAWKRLNLRNAELLLVGECRPEMVTLLNEYGKPNVRLLGMQSLENTAKLYRQSSVLVQPSVHEGLSMVLLEAMASGLPVIATNRTGAEDCVTHGSEGWVVPPRSMESLSEAILRCYQNRDLSESMGKKARTKIEGAFTLEHYNARIIALYGDLLSSNDKVRI